MNWWIVIGLVIAVLITGKIIANKYPKVTWEEIVNYEKPKKKTTRVILKPQGVLGGSGGRGSGAIGVTGAVGMTGAIMPDYGITDMLSQAHAVKRNLESQYASQRHYLDQQLQNQIAARQQFPPPPYYKFHVGDAVTHVPSGLKTFVRNRFGEMEDRTSGAIAFNPHYDLENGMITIPEGDLV